MGRLARSWEMTKTSFGVIRSDKELLWLPVLSFLATVVAIMAIAGVGFVAGVFPEVTTEEGIDPVQAALAFLLYLAVAFVQVFFHAATVAAAHQRLSGGDPTVGSALRAAGQHVGRLFLWSMVVATVNVILHIIRERAGWLGRIMASFAGTAWNLATFFVVPVLLFEKDAGVGTGLRRSGGLFKQTWGETVVGEVGIGFVAGIVGAVIVFGTVAGAILLSAVPYASIAVIVLGATALILSMIIFSVAGAVYKTALYRYATTGHAGGDFANTTMARAFRA